MNRLQSKARSPRIIVIVSIRILVSVELVFRGVFACRCSTGTVSNCLAVGAVDESMTYACGNVLWCYDTH